MDIVKELGKLYNADEPILLAEIKTALREYSSPYIFQCLRKAVNEGKLIRFDEAIYYIPSESVLGISSLNISKVVEKKYLIQDGCTIGFYSGIGLLNAIGGTRQMPFVYEIITNREKTRKREIQLGKIKLILRKSRCLINDANKVILQILELCNKYIWDKAAAEAVLNYAKTNGITMRDIFNYAKYFPARAIKNASEVLHGIA